MQSLFLTHLQALFPGLESSPFPWHRRRSRLGAGVVARQKNGPVRPLSKVRVSLARERNKKLFAYSPDSMAGYVRQSQLSLFVAQCFCLSLVWLVITIRTIISDNSDSLLEMESDTIVLCVGHTFIMAYMFSEPRATPLTLCPP